MQVLRMAQAPRRLKNNDGSSPMMFQKPNRALLLKVRNMVAQAQHWFKSSDGSRTMMAQEQ
jgi:hypothetical protein